MIINIEKTSLCVTNCSSDAIGIKKGNNIIASGRDIRFACNWLEKNGNKGMKISVLPILLEFSDKDIELFPNEFICTHYQVSFDDTREYTVTDKSNRNNKRWIYNKRQMVERVYFLEINRLNSKNIEELLADIESLNINFYKMMGV